MANEPTKAEQPSGVSNEMKRDYVAMKIIDKPSQLGGLCCPFHEANDLLIG